MFCSNCGNKLEPDARFCDVCGAKVEQEFEEQPEPKAAAPQQAPARKPAPAPARTAAHAAPRRAGQKPDLKKFRIPALAAAAVVVVVAAVSVFTGGGYKKPVTQVVKLINGKETELVKYLDATLPDFAVDAFEDIDEILSDVTDYQEAMDQFQMGLDDLFLEMESWYGDDVKVKVKAVDQAELSRSELNSIRNDYRRGRSEVRELQGENGLAEALDLTGPESKRLDAVLESLAEDLDEIEIDKGYCVVFEGVVEGGETEDEQEFELNLIRINGKWTVDVTGGDFQRIINSL